MRADDDRLAAERLAEDRFAAGRRADADFRLPFLDPFAFPAFLRALGFFARDAARFAGRRARVAARRGAGLAVPAGSVLGGLAAVAVPDVPCPMSPTVRVALPGVLPPVSGPCVSRLSSPSSSRYESSAIASPCRVMSAASIGCSAC